jgi:hypothetical protein
MTLAEKFAKKVAEARRRLGITSARGASRGSTERLQDGGTFAEVLARLKGEVGIGGKRTMTFELTPMAQDDADRKELTCLWCRYPGCDYTFILRGAAKGSAALQILGVHAVCLDKHEAILLKERSKRKE